MPRQPVQKRILRINHDDDPLEQSALVLSVMAYPRRGEEEKRIDAFEALLARPLHEFRRTMRIETLFPNPTHEASLELKTEKEATLLSRKIKRILGARAEVGEIAEPWIIDLWNGSGPDLPPLTDTVLESRVSELTNRSPENWVRRTWRPAKPAFHLYAAYHIAHLQLPPEVQDPFNPQSGPVRAPDTDLTRDIIRVAMGLQMKLIEDPRFPFTDTDLIWLEGTITENSATNRLKVPLI